VLYCDICIVSLKYFFYLRHFKLDFFYIILHYITYLHNDNDIIIIIIKCPCNNFIKCHFNQYFVNNNNMQFLLCHKVVSSEADIRETWRHPANSCTRHCSSLSVTVNSSVGDGVDNDEMNDADRCQTCCGIFDVTVWN